MISGCRLSLLFCLFIFHAATFQGLGQDKLEQPDEWAAGMAKPGQQGNDHANRLNLLLVKADSSTGFRFLDKIYTASRARNGRFLARYKALRAVLLYYTNIYQSQVPPEMVQVRAEIKTLLQEAMDLSYRSRDEYLVAYISKVYSQTIIYLGETGAAVMYALNGVELSEKLNYSLFAGDYEFLSSMLFRVREYESSVLYARKAVAAWKREQPFNARYLVLSMNTLALGYHRQGKLDSALLYYREALELAEKYRQPVWTGIVSGNIGQICYQRQLYDSALALFKKDYQVSLDSGFYDNGANSLQWAARTELARGNPGEAREMLRQAYAWLNRWPDAGYRRNAYYTSVQLFRSLKQIDSAFYYYNLYTALNDSLEKVVNANSLDIARARLSDQASRYNIEQLYRDQEAALRFRNLIILIIILGSVIALLYLNRQRLRSQYKEKLAIQQQEAAEQLAREQLEMVTRNLIEKTQLAEELQRQLANREAAAEKQELAKTISDITILTEADWDKFRELFEQLYPGFFFNLREKVGDITQAELRMAALTRLRLPAGQMATVLGISPNSVYKTKQRLRQRLNLDTDQTLETYLASV